jgi:hypothetical protein
MTPQEANLLTNQERQEILASGWRGAKTMMALAEMAALKDRSNAKGAKWTMEIRAHQAARPGAEKERQAVTSELLKLAADKAQPAPIRGEALFLLGFTAGNRDVPAIAPLLNDPDTRDEARMALERIPGSASLNALKSALRTAPADFRPALEQSVRNRAQTPKTVGIKKV